MKKVMLFLCLITSSLFATNELDKQLSIYYQKNGIKIENKSVDDYTMVKRLYLDVAGRIPTTEEIKSYVTDRSTEKRHKLVDRILYSEDYVNNFYNFWADLLRIRPERLSDNIQMKSYPYIHYVRDSLRLDKPYDILVKELLTASGKPTENGATGYILRDDGMTFDNIALSTQIFLADSFSCCQCHDDPFSDKTMKQFYELASFFNNDNRENRKDYRDILKKIDTEIQAINGNTRIDNNVRQLMGANLVNITDNPSKTVKYPADYKYDNAKPGEIAKAVSPDRKVIGADNKRQEIAQWFTSHPNFSPAIANRLWMNIVGNNLVYPQVPTNFDIEESPNKELIKFLGNYLKENSYSIKAFIRLIVLSDFYSRPSYSGMTENYKFQGMLVKRLSAHQIWDSILTLILDDPNYSRVSFEPYSELFKINWETINGENILKKAQDIREWDNKLNSNFLKYKNIELVRSCFNLRNNGFVSQFLKEFGASDRVLLDTTSNDGTITQILTLMNSPLMDLITDKKSQVMKSNDKNMVFTSIMSRPMNIAERPIIEKLHDNDMVWVLLNSREALFRR